MTRTLVRLVACKLELYNEHCNMLIISHSLLVRNGLTNHSETESGQLRSEVEEGKGEKKVVRRVWR